MYMALIAVPKGAFRIAAWILMTVAGWLVTGAQSVWATVNYSWYDGSGTLVIEGDSNDNTNLYVSVNAQNEVEAAGSVIMNGSTPVNPGDVRFISINGQGGDDSIYIKDVTESEGFDALVRTTLAGGAGVDTIVGSDNEAGDSIVGGAENDLLKGGVGSDTIKGEGGPDVIYGGDDGDLILGGDGNDWLVGEDGADDLFGEDGNDTILGGDGPDLLVGSDGADSLLGEAGDDDIHHWDHFASPEDEDVADESVDTLTGGLGVDSFKYNNDDEDTVTDFQAGVDEEWFDPDP